MHIIHRGLVNKNCKENTLKSFKKSFSMGFGIETDIHSTKDNKFICFHDFTLNRIFKKNLSVKNLDYFYFPSLKIYTPFGEISNGAFNFFANRSNKLVSLSPKSIVKLIL